MDKIFVAYTMSNFEALYTVLRAESIEQAAKVLTVIYNNVFENVYDDEICENMTDMEKLKLVGIEIKEFAYDLSVMKKTLAVIDRYKLTSLKGSESKVNDWVKSFGYVNITSDSITAAIAILRFPQNFLSDDEENGLNKMPKAVELVVNKYMDIFCLEEKYAEFSVEANVVMEEIIHGKDKESEDNKA